MLHLIVPDSFFLPTLTVPDPLVAVNTICCTFLRPLQTHRPRSCHSVPLLIQLALGSIMVFPPTSKRPYRPVAALVRTMNTNHLRPRSCEARQRPLSSLQYSAATSATVLRSCWIIMRNAHHIMPRKRRSAKPTTALTAISHTGSLHPTRKVPTGRRPARIPVCQLDLALPYCR